MKLKMISRDFMRMLMLQMPVSMDKKTIVKELRCSIQNRKQFNRVMHGWSESKASLNYSTARSKKKKKSIANRYYNNHKIGNIAMYHSQKVPFKFKLINEEEFLTGAEIYSVRQLFSNKFIR